MLKNHMVPKRKNHNLCNTVWRVLFSTRDVLDDAQRTFIKENEDEENERETQLDELMRVKQSAFNWSDEELLGEMGPNDQKAITVKNKYDKKTKGNYDKKTNDDKLAHCKISPLLKKK